MSYGEPHDASLWAQGAAPLTNGAEHIQNPRSRLFDAIISLTKAVWAALGS